MISISPGDILILRSDAGGGGEYPVDLGFDRRLGGNNLLALLAQEGEFSLEYFNQYVFLAREVVEEGALGNFNLLGYVLHRGGLEPLLVDGRQDLRAVQQQQVQALQAEDHSTFIALAKWVVECQMATANGRAMPEPPAPVRLILVQDELTRTTGQ